MKGSILNRINKDINKSITDNSNSYENNIKYENHDYFILNQIKNNIKEDIEHLKESLSKQFQNYGMKFAMLPNINDDNFLISNNSFLGTENIE